MSFTVVIPARMASTRLPGKPLADIAGQPMIVKVAERARASAAAEVLVAVDDARVRDAVERTGFRALLTDPAHRSGSDRVMEVVEKLGLDDSAVVVNVQGDEPLIPPVVIDQVGLKLVRDPSVDVATLCEPLVRASDLFNPNVVKVVRDGSGKALYFSRAPIPWDREAFPRRSASELETQTLQSGRWWRHIGVYAYRVSALRRFCSWPPSMLESLEYLEQLRLLDHGMAVAVEEAAEPVPAGVDTPADLERVRRYFGA